MAIGYNVDVRGPLNCGCLGVVNIHFVFSCVWVGGHGMIWTHMRLSMM